MILYLRLKVGGNIMDWSLELPESATRVELLLFVQTNKQKRRCSVVTKRLVTVSLASAQQTSCFCSKCEISNMSIFAFFKFSTLQLLYPKIGTCTLERWRKIWRNKLTRGIHYHGWPYWLGRGCLFCGFGNGQTTSRYEFIENFFPRKFLFFS